MKNLKNNHYKPDKMAPARSWALEERGQTMAQFQQARSLPIAVKAALMPDAHPGYGLPIGGVLAVKNAVIPYAVGVDIACRMRLSILDWPLSSLLSRREALINALKKTTRFGIGAGFNRKQRLTHPVMDKPWQQHPVLAGLQSKAWEQLGSSGTGNHFVEFVELELLRPFSTARGAGLAPVADNSSREDNSSSLAIDLPAGEYLALLSHSGSRGSGAEVARHYSKLAQKLKPNLPSELKNLAWLELDSEAGQEYWQAMQLMGEYAAANHELIHQRVLEFIGAQAIAKIENHHNFAWQEEHDKQKLVVHRKGATPAHAGMLGIVPGSMATPGYVVKGLGHGPALNSCSHGAGRVMSRKQARQNLRGINPRNYLKEMGVELLSAGQDELPQAYQDIERVMAAQTDMVQIIARFMPRIVKMAPGHEKAED